MKSLSKWPVLILLAATLTLCPSICRAQKSQARSAAGAYVSGAAAKLAPAHINKLLRLQTPVALPTYIPAGFRVSRVTATRDTKTSPTFAIVDYSITYAAPGGKRFSIKSANEGIGDIFINEEKTIQGSNPYFEGSVVYVGYLYDDELGRPGKQIASEWVSSLKPYQLKKNDKGTQMYHLRAEGISLQEALKIMESLRYLQR